MHRRGQDVCPAGVQHDHAVCPHGRSRRPVFSVKQVIRIEGEGGGYLCQLGIVCGAQIKSCP